MVMRPSRSKAQLPLYRLVTSKVGTFSFSTLPRGFLGRSANTRKNISTNLGNVDGISSVSTRANIVYHKDGFRRTLRLAISSLIGTRRAAAKAVLASSPSKDYQ